MVRGATRHLRPWQIVTNDDMKGFISSEGLLLWKKVWGCENRPVSSLVL